MKTIVHVGDSKTGSTAIQLALGNHADELRRQGIFWRPFRPLINHNRLLRVAGARPGWMPEEKFAEELRDVNSQLREYREELQRSAEVVAQVISSEMLLLQNRPTIDQVLGAVCTDPDFHVLAYIRNPADHYLSLCQQQLKSNDVFTHPAKSRRPVGAALSEWSSVAARGDFDVRPFQKQSLLEGSVVADFAAWLRQRLDIKVEHLQDSPVNSGLTAEAAVCLQTFSQQFLVGVRGFVEPRNRLISLLGWMCRGSSFGFTQMRLRPHIRSAVLRLNEAETSAALRYMGDADRDIAAAWLPVEATSSQNECTSNVNDIRSIIDETDPELTELLLSLLVRGDFDLRATEGYLSAMLTSPRAKLVFIEHLEFIAPGRAAEVRSILL